MRPDLNGLWVCPSIPSEWKEMTMEKSFRGKKLHITVKNPDGKESGFKEFYINGKKADQPYVPESELLEENEIELVM